VDLVLDAVGGPMFEPALKSLRLGGRQVAITSVGRRRVEFDMIDFLLRSQAADWRGFDEIQLNNGGAKIRAEFAAGP
jgi:NADPH:quinone reductase-like Zn-dependent oxidoreductase